MKKVRVLKEMPKVRVGEEVFATCDLFYTWRDSVGIDFLITNGWLEWVEEDKSLESQEEKETTGQETTDKKNFFSPAVLRFAKENNSIFSVLVNYFQKLIMIILKEILLKI